MSVLDFSGIPRKEEESQYTCTVYYSGEAVASPEKPIPVLDNSSQDRKHHSCGVFANQARRTAFKFRKKDGAISADILRVDARFISLLYWLGENHVSIHLSGQNRGDGYAVYKIREVAFDSGTKLSVEDGSLQSMIDRPLASSAPETELVGEDLEEIGNDVKLTSLQSLPDFMSYAGRTLPDNVRIWARRNLVVARSYEAIPEERYHTQRALPIMMSIRWKDHYLEFIDPRKARRILDEELYGMKRVKQRIIGTIIQINRTYTLLAYSMLPAGPTGIRESQIAYAVARILKLPWTTLDMSSINDPEQLTDSSCIYSSVESGIVMEAFSVAGESNLIFIIDELDKTSAGKDNGNPADVLLILLDNLGFTNNYIECMTPTGGVYPTTTIDDKGQVSAPLISCFAVIDTPDYTPEEKKIIFFRYTMSEVLRRTRLRESECVVTKETLDAVIEKYADITEIQDLKQAAKRMAANALCQMEVEHVPAVVFDESTVRGLLGQGLFLFRRVYGKFIIKTTGYVMDTGAAVRRKRFMNKQGGQRGCSMYYTTDCAPPVGGIKLAADGERSAGLWLEGQKYFTGTVKEKMTEDRELGIFKHTRGWLDRYFARGKPVLSGLLLVSPGGEFRQGAWEVLYQIPYGQLTTYDDIAKKMVVRMNRETMSAQTVSGTVGHDPISIIIPCHRVAGTTDSLTGYARGIDRKVWLLEHEGADMEGLSMPERGTAL